MIKKGCMANPNMVESIERRQIVHILAKGTAE